MAQVLARSNPILDAASKDSNWLGSARPVAVKSKWGAESELLNKQQPTAPDSFSPLAHAKPAFAGDCTPTYERTSHKVVASGQHDVQHNQEPQEHEMAEDLSTKPLIVKLFYNYDKDWVFTDFYINNAATLEGEEDSAHSAALSDLHSDYKANGSFYLQSARGPAYNWPQSSFYPISPINDTDKRNLLDTDYEGSHPRPHPAASPRSDSPALPRTPSPTAKPSSPMWTSTTASSPTSSSSPTRSTTASSRYKSDFSSASSSEDLLSDTSDPASDPTPAPSADPTPSRPVSEAPPTHPDNLQDWVYTTGPDGTPTLTQDTDTYIADPSAPSGMRRKRVSFATLPYIEEQAAAEAATPTPPASPPSSRSLPTPVNAAPAAAAAATTAAAATAVAAAAKPPVAPRQANLDSISARFAAVTANLDMRLGAIPRRSQEAAAAAARPPRPGMRALSASPLLEAQSVPESTPSPTAAAPRAAASPSPTPSAGRAAPSPTPSAGRATPSPTPSAGLATPSPTARSTPSPTFAAAAAASPTAAKAAAAAAAATSPTTASSVTSASDDMSSARSASPAPDSPKSWTTDEDSAEAADTVTPLPQHYPAPHHQPPQQPEQQRALPPAALPPQHTAETPSVPSDHVVSRRPQHQVQPQQQARAAAAAVPLPLAEPMSAAAAAQARAASLNVERSDESVTQMVVRSSASVTVRDMEKRSLEANGYEPAKNFWSWWMWNRTATVARKKGYVPPSALGIERAMLQKKEPAAEPEVAARRAVPNKN